jgi:phosphatidylglycerophosphatase A
VRALRARRTKAAAAGPALWIATWGGSGFVPFAPGSWASLSALPLAWLLVLAGGPWLLAAAALAVFLVGIWASERYMAAVGIHDPTAIVIDEIAGQWLTLCLAPLDPFAYAAGFFLFRVFDVLKPWPVSWLDRRVGGGLGVMIDDVAAALYAGGVLLILDRWLLP